MFLWYLFLEFFIYFEFSPFNYIVVHKILPFCRLTPCSNDASFALQKLLHSRCTNGFLFRKFSPVLMSSTLFPFSLIFSLYLILYWGIWSILSSILFKFFYMQSSSLTKKTCWRCLISNMLLLIFLTFINSFWMTHYTSYPYPLSFSPHQSSVAGFDSHFPI